MKTIKLIVTGEIASAVYRNEVSHFAFKLGITGKLKYLRNDCIKILAQGSKVQLEKFLKAITIRKMPVFVEKIKKKEITMQKQFTFFKIMPNTRSLSEIELGASFLIAIADAFEYAQND